MSALKVINPKAVIVNLAGLPIQGFAPGTFLTIEPMADAFASVAGADGEVVRVASNDKRYLVKLTLLQSSSSNIALSALHQTDLNAPNGAGVGIFSATDLNGTTVFTGAQSWIKKPPTQEFATTATNREWEIEVAEGLAVIGGN